MKSLWNIPFFAFALLLLTTPAVAQDRGGTTAGGASEGTSPRAPILADAVEDPVTLLRLAGSALSAHRLAEASDLLERAEARLLTRSELASEADRPAVGGAIGALASARDALARRDDNGARMLIDEAIGRLQRGEPPAVATLPATPAPLKSGLPPPMPLDGMPGKPPPL